MKQNMGNTDRVIRIFLSLALAILFFSGSIRNEITATVVWIVGIIFFITGIIGICPIYTLPGIRTIKKGKRR
jgi:hypothetical protein